MSVKPILFSTPMVQAIQAGTKTVTRRVIKPQPVKVIPADNEIGAVVVCGGSGRPRESYHVGDVLYVRETWARIGNEKAGRPMHYEYRADCANPDYFSDGFMATWRPSIHMPKEAARIFLRVTDVKVAHIQDMTENDAVIDFGLCADAIKAVGLTPLCKSVWNGTIKKADLERYGWDANPWVWVIAFRRIAKEEI